MSATKAEPTVNKYKPYHVDLEAYYGFEDMPFVDAVVELIPDEGDPNFTEPTLVPGDHVVWSDPLSTKTQRGTVVRWALDHPDPKPILQTYCGEVFFGIMPPFYRVWINLPDGGQRGVAAGRVRRMTASEKATYALDFGVLLDEPLEPGNGTLRDWLREKFKDLLLRCVLERQDVDAVLGAFEAGVERQWIGVLDGEDLVKGVVDHVFATPRDSDPLAEQMYQALEGLLTGIAVHNDNLRGQPVQRIEGPVVSAATAATTRWRLERKG